jgi:hypothetical protein
MIVWDPGKIDRKVCFVIKYLSELNGEPCQTSSALGGHRHLFAGLSAFYLKENRLPFFFPARKKQKMLQACRLRRRYITGFFFANVVKSKMGSAWLQ